ncbi:MAG TPA: Hsp20/alpha crystallin family protein [Trichocoleus sp.]|jgi:HSP20 family protein
MLVRYWNPWQEMDTIRRQIDRAFDGLTQPTSSEFNWTPAIELQDSGDALVLKAQLPGIDPKQLNVEVTKEAVSITGERRQESKTEENGYIKSEFRYGTFHRIVPLPVAVINDQVQAEYKDGILVLTLPKVVEARNKVVKINLADLTQASVTDAIEGNEQAAHN